MGVLERSETHLPDQQPPRLHILPQVRYDLDVEEVFGVCDTDEYRGSNDAKEETLGDRGRCEA